MPSAVGSCLGAAGNLLIKIFTIRVRCFALIHFFMQLYPWHVTITSLWNVMAFLSKVWNLKFTHAAAALSVMIGSAKVMLFFMTFLVDTFFGHYRLLSFTTLSFSIGWGLFALSTSTSVFKDPSILCETGSLCVGDLQWGIFQVSIGLIVVGIAGHMTSSEAFLGEQLSCEDVEHGDSETPRVITGVVVIIAYILNICILPFVKPWGLRIGIPAKLMVVATLLFFFNSSSYRRLKPLGSPITPVFRVIFASCLKIKLRVPRDPKVPHSNYLR